MKLSQLEFDPLLCSCDRFVFVDSFSSASLPVPDMSLVEPVEVSVEDTCGPLMGLLSPCSRLAKGEIGRDGCSLDLSLISSITAEEYECDGCQL